MGTGYKGDSKYYRSIGQNLPTLSSEYEYNNGLFGTEGKSKDTAIRNIISDNPLSEAKNFYDKLTYGGIEKKLYYKDGNIKGYQTRMADGTIVNYRFVSSSPDKSPAVDIDVQYSNRHGELVTQKIHFIGGK